MFKQQPLQFEFRANQGFSEFFAGNNQETIAHLQHCVSGTGELQIYLWGKSGLGKSHLLRASCQLALELKRSSFYLELSKSSLPDSRILTGLEDIELVCIDNIDQIVGNLEWETAFFNFFNVHREQNHSLIVSAPCLANELALLLPDIKTRLNWGLALKILSMSDDDKILALAFRARLLGFEVSPRLGQFILKHCDRELSSLWKLLEKLDQASLAAKRKLTIPFVKKLLTDDIVR
jgi:DnaA family protein